MSADAQIVLPCGRIAFIDAVDLPLVAGLKLFSKRVHLTWYVECRSPGARPWKVRILLHRFLTGYPRTDHKNGNGLDCRRQNLRECTHAQNMRNGRKRTARRFKGVFRAVKGAGWFAQIHVNHRTIYGGTHATEEAAARAYDMLAIEHHGEFARLNFPVVHA